MGHSAMHRIMNNIYVDNHNIVIYKTGSNDQQVISKYIVFVSFIEL